MIESSLKLPPKFDLGSKDLRLYIDGVEVAVATYGGAWPPGSAVEPSLVLTSDSGGTDWLGTLHVVAIYGRALSPEEVLTNYYADIGEVR